MSRLLSGVRLVPAVSHFLFIIDFENSALLQVYLSDFQNKCPILPVLLLRKNLPLSHYTHHLTLTHNSGSAAVSGIR